MIESSRDVVEALVDFRESDSIKAIVLRVDSPGGGVGPSQEIHREVVKTVSVKPVVVSMGAVAASGGYYIAAPASRIVANPGTITGSIGVIMEFTNMQELLHKIGLQSDVVKSGRYKDVGSAVREMTSEERDLLQNVIDEVHLQFVEAVASGRKLSVEETSALADGRILTGSQAVAAGLVDELGNLQDAIELAADLGGISATPHVVYPEVERRSWLDYMIQETAVRLSEGMSSAVRPGLSYRWDY